MESGGDNGLTRIYSKKQEPSKQNEPSVRAVGVQGGDLTLWARPTGGVLCMLICIVIRRDWMFVRTKDLNCGETEFVDLKCVCEYIVIPREYFLPEIEP